MISVRAMSSGSVGGSSSAGVGVSGDRDGARSHNVGASMFGSDALHCCSIRSDLHNKRHLSQRRLFVALLAKLACFDLPSCNRSSCIVLALFECYFFLLACLAFVWLCFDFFSQSRLL